MEEQEAERENELTAFGLCAGGVISNVLEAAVFEEGEEFDLETSSDLDDSDAEEEHSPVSVMESKIEAVSKSWESKQQQELSSGCATPSLVDSDDDYEEVLSLVSDDAFDEDCNGERAMLYVQAALSVAKGATDGALADAFGFEEEEARIQQEENIQLDHLILKNTGELASTDAEELASTYQSTDQEAFTEEAREETEEEESSEPLDGDDGEVSTVAPSECDIQEVFQESAVEDIAFDCVSGLLDSGIDGLMTRIMPGDALTEVDAAELATVEAPFAPDVAASQPDFVAMNSVPEAPHVLASVPEPMVLTETPGDAPEPELRAAAVEPVPTAVAQAAAVTQAIEAADVASAQLSEFTSKAAVPKAEPRPQEQPQPRAAQPSPPSEEVEPRPQEQPQPQAARPPPPSEEDWSTILAELQREAAAQPPVRAAPVRPSPTEAPAPSLPSKPTTTKGAVRPPRAGDRPMAPRGEPAPRAAAPAPPAPSPQATAAPRQASAPVLQTAKTPVPVVTTKPEMGKEAMSPSKATNSTPALWYDVPGAAPSHFLQATTSPTASSMNASRSRRRIIGGVVRAPIDVDREPTLSASTFKRGMMGGPEATIQRYQAPQKATATMFRMDRHEDPTATARESSLTKGYDALGAEFHRLDEDDMRRGPFGRQASFGSLSRGPSSLGPASPPTARLRGPLGAASALVLDLGESAAGSSWGRAEPVQGRPPATPLDVLGRAPSSSGLRVSKALPLAPAGGAARTSSGSLAWSMRMARSAAKRNGLAEAY